MGRSFIHTPRLWVGRSFTRLWVDRSFTSPPQPRGFFIRRLDWVCIISPFCIDNCLSDYMCIYTTCDTTVKPPPYLGANERTSGVDDRNSIVYRVCYDQTVRNERTNERVEWTTDLNCVPGML